MLARRRGRELYRSGRFRALADFAEELERDAWELGRPRSRAIARVLSGHAALESGRLGFARMRFESLVDLPLHPRDATLDVVHEARVGLGRVALAAGRPRAALEHVRAALSVLRPAERGATFTAALRGLAAAHAELDSPDDAATVYRRALRLARRADDPLETALAAAGLVFAEVAMRGPDFDRRLPRLALSTADLADSPLARIEALRARAAEARAAAEAETDAAGRQVAGEEALADLQEALTVALQIGSLLRQARIERDIAGVLDALGRPDRAEARRSRARELLERDDRPR